MNFKILKNYLIFMIPLAILPIACTSPLQQQTQNTTEQTDTTDENEIVKLLHELQQEFNRYEATNPQQGYCVTIATTPQLQGRIQTYGGSRTTKLLSGISHDESHRNTGCTFCTKVKNHAENLQDFHDGTCAVKSLNNQILIIPNEHYDHLFVTPSDMQIKILTNILKIREEYPHNIQRPIEFHCGAAAGQTVFHLHGRTGVYIN